ncbi:MAG: hypothetical protein LBE56_01555 [Tannerella sp.]|jgi:hypothetical protein|nr:hypothetical protein [Tannerella sp.]
MQQAFEHIEQARFLLAQIFESGFDSGRNASSGLRECMQKAKELGLSGGADLLSSLSAQLNAFAAGQCPVDSVTASYCQAITYYNKVADLLVIETISTK